MAASDKTSDLNRKLDTDVSADGVDRNPDAITGAPGSHPTGVGIGSASGAATGAALGAIGGPIGAIIGGVAGAIVGGYTGKAAGEWNDPTEDEAYWKEAHVDRPYVQQGESYDTYADAYKYGGTAARTHAEGSTGVIDKVKGAVGLGADAGPATFESREATIRSEYEASPAASKLDYSKARSAIKDAFDRTIQLREERLNVGKERVQTGEANVRKEVTTEHRTVEVPLQREELVIERRAASGTGNAGTIGDAETIRIPLSEERATVNKSTVVTEEVGIGKKTVTDTKSVGADVRKETLKVDDTVRDATKR